MFTSGSPYSSFFMSGLMSNSAVEPRRRGSLPTHSAPASLHFNERDVDQERSFLSLDLAETQSLHSEKRRKQKSEGSSEHMKAPHSAPLRLRTSRDTLRNVPSPKPAPSSTLPQVPRKNNNKLSNLKSPGLLLETNTAGSSTDLEMVSPLSIKLASAVLPPTHTVSVPAPLRSNSIASSSTVSTRYRRIKRSDALARLEGRARIVSSPLRSSGRNFMSMSDDEDSNEDEDEADDDGDDDGESEYGSDDYSDESDGFVDLAIDFSTSPISTSRRKYDNAFGFEDDEDVIIPRSPARRSRSSRGHHSYSRSLTPFSNSMTPYHSRSSLSSPYRSHSISQSHTHSQTHSQLYTSTESTPARRRRSRTLTMFPLKSFIDFKSDASFRERDSRGVGQDEATSLRQSLQSRKAEDSWRWRSWIEIAGVA